jgi:hypothetical protein
MKSQSERREEQRREKLARLREQIEGGSLVVRQMTDDERKHYPPRERKHSPKWR